MSVRLLSATVLLVLAGSYVAWSQKPADLPQNVLDNCGEQPVAAAAPQQASYGQEATSLQLMITPRVIINAEEELLQVGMTDERCGDSSADSDDGKPKCGCAECSCCGCKGTEQEAADADSQCACDKCSCCGCSKKAPDKQTAACGGCCASCPLCSQVGMPPFAWVVVADMCPPMHWCFVCPMMNPQLADLVRPCLHSCKVECRKALAAMGATKAFRRSCAAGEECTDDAKPGCGHCGDSHKKHADAQCPLGHFQWKVIVHKGCHVEKLAVMPCEVEMLTVMPKEKDDAATKPTVVCPYLRDKAVQASAPPAVAPEQLGTVLDNLAKLQQARRVFAKAEHHFRAGDYDRADEYYGRVMELCPGSRWDAEARARRYAVAVLKMLQEAGQSAVEEAEPAQQVEPPPCEPACSDAPNDAGMQQFKQKFIELLDQARAALEAGDFQKAKNMAQEAAGLETPDNSAEEAAESPTPDNCAKVAELVEAAQRAYAAGCHCEAQAYVEQALELDPDCPAAKALQGQLTESQTEERGGAESQSDDEDVPDCGQEPPMPQEPPHCPRLGFRHRLPPVDPMMIEALQKALVEMENAATPKRDGWFASERCQNRPLAEVGKWMQKAVDAFCDEVGVDVDLNSPRGPRGQVRLQVGSMAVCMKVRSDGHGTVRFELWSPEKAEDLRDAQAAHNANVLGWIESMNNGGNAGTNDSEASEEPLFQLDMDLDPDW